MIRKRKGGEDIPSRKKSRLEEDRRERQAELDRENFKSKVILYSLGAVIFLVFALVALNPYASPSAEEGMDFLEMNVRNDPEVKVTKSGLQYKVLYHNDNFVQTPSLNTRCKCTYEGRLIDGTIFDKGVNRVFRPRGVIKGWQEALMMMSIGDKYKLFIPSHLAYGNKRHGSLIAPGSVLVFELKLVEMIDPTIV
jgi:hypothetical protein